jgi:hypothetical protein
MTNQTTTLVSRQAGVMAPSVPAQAMPGAGMGLPERIQLANALSKAGPMLPKCYQGNPGAIMLLMSWAEQHGKDLLTAAQGISVNDQGQLIVSAEMRVELANDRGYDIVDITPDDKRRTECTVQVTGPGLPPGGRCLTVRMEDVHESVRSLTTKNGKPTPWATAPADMLLRTAQRQADKRFCRSAAAVIDQEDWIEPERDDVVDVLASEPESALDEPPAETTPTPEPEPETPAAAEPDAEVDDLTAPPPEPVTKEQLRKAGKVADLLRAASEIKGQSVAVVDDIVEDQTLARLVLERISR